MQININISIKFGITFGINEDNLVCTSEPGGRAKLRNEERTDAFNFRLNAIVRRIARTIRRTSRA